MNLIKRFMLLGILIIILVKILDLIFPYFITPLSNIQASSRSIVLREFAKPGSYYAIPNDEYARGVKITDLEKKKYKLTVNDDGFISSEQQLNKQHVDIIFFGGSTTEQIYVEEQYRFPELVGQLLSQSLGRNVYTLNAGVSGNHSLHSNLVLISKGLKYKPKFVVMMNNINDWSLLSKTGTYFDAPDSREIIVKPKSLFYQIAKLIKDLLLPNSGQNIRIVFNNLFTENPNDEFSGYDRFSVKLNDFTNIYRSSIISFIELCKAWDITPILMTQMYKSSLTKDEHWEYQDSFNEIIRNLGKQYDVLVVDLDKELSNLDEHLYDSIHLNTKGSIKVANIIAESILTSYPDM